MPGFSSVIWASLFRICNSLTFLTKVPMKRAIASNWLCSNPVEIWALGLWKMGTGVVESRIKIWFEILPPAATIRAILKLIRVFIPP